MRTTIVVGGGFSGTLFALKLAAAEPTDRVVLIELGRRPGRGLAYGACDPGHILNVPVSRMEVGLKPAFAAWLEAERVDVWPEAKLADAFVPRKLFGDYLAAQLRKAQSPYPERGLHLVRGEAVALLDDPPFGVRLWDGREIPADKVVLALGNLPPRGFAALSAVSANGDLYAPDPWSLDALDGLDPNGGVLLIGTGLTAVDVALRLANAGHTGPMVMVSRHGLLPLRHRGGGSWPTFLDAGSKPSPAEAMALIRREAARAVAAGVPWQRILDAVRPAVAGVWHGWSAADRSRFLRHARAYWDVHRHRMAPEIAERLDRLLSTEQLRVTAGRLIRATSAKTADVTIAQRSGGDLQFSAARIINCTGPRTDFDKLGMPLIADLRGRRLLRADPLRLGIDTEACALVDEAGRPSDRLFALGPLTRPAWWEVTAVPEIKVQVESLVSRFRDDEPALPLSKLQAAFSDIGAGI